MSTRLVLLEDSAEGSLSRLLQELGVHFEAQASLQEVFSGDNINSKKNVLILSGQHLNAARAFGTDPVGFACPTLWQFCGRPALRVGG